MSSVQSGSQHSKTSVRVFKEHNMNTTETKEDLTKDQLSSLQSSKYSTASGKYSTASGVDRKVTSVPRQSQFGKDSDTSSVSKKSVQLTSNSSPRTNVSVSHDPNSVRPSIAAMSTKHTQQSRDSRHRKPSQMGMILSGSPRVSMWRRPSQWYRPGRSVSDPPSEPPVRYANSYQLGPDENQRFNSSKAETIMQEVLESMLSGECYTNSLQSCSLAKLISETIKDKMKMKKEWSPRYKLICLVTLVEWHSQGVQVASQCLWAGEVDNTATAQYSSSTFKAVATVFAIYHE